MAIRPSASETRSVILDAAAAEIFDTGFTSASLSRIAQRLGLTKGALSYHFPTKQVIFDALMDRLYTVVTESATAADERYPDSPSHALLRFIAEIRRVMLGDKVLNASFQVIHDVSIDPSLLLDSYNRWQGKISQYIERAVNEEGIELTVTADQAAEMLVATISGARLTRRFTKSVRAIDEPPYLRVLLEGVGFHNAADLLAAVQADFPYTLLR